MTLALDHVFIMASSGGPEAERLCDFGLAEGAPNRHPGQGTACRRFFFHNAMLELMWVDSPEEADSETTRPTQLFERFSGRGEAASPFGVCVHPLDAAGADASFPSWEYRPAYLPDPLAIWIAADAPLSEPVWFSADFGRPDAAPVERRQPLEHPVGFREVTGVAIEGPGLRRLSVAARKLAAEGVVAISQGEQHLLELEFDGGQQGRRVDFRPDLPLIFRW